VISESLINVYEVAAVEPNFTVVRSVKPLPMIVTEVPPAAVPDDGEILVTVGRVAVVVVTVAVVVVVAAV
jgi:hypothetical protein